MCGSAVMRPLEIACYGVAGNAHGRKKQLILFNF